MQQVLGFHLMKPGGHRRSVLFDVIHHATEGLTSLTPAFLKGWTPPLSAKHFTVFFYPRPNFCPWLSPALVLNAILVGLAFIVLRGDGLAHETGDENACGWHPLLPSRDHVQDLMTLQGLDVAEEPLRFGEILKDPCPWSLIWGPWKMMTWGSVRIICIHTIPYRFSKWWIYPMGILNK